MASYQHERDQFVDRMAREGLPMAVTLALLRAATTLNRYAELACSSEVADRDRVPCPGILAKHADRCICDDWPTGTHAAGRHSLVPRYRIMESRIERRLDARIAALGHGWALAHAGDPRGYVLRVIPPSYAERNAGRSVDNLKSIGVPSRESGIRW